VLISATTPDLLLSLVASATLLERAAAAFPGPTARSRPFNLACCVEKLSVLLPA